VSVSPEETATHTMPAKLKADNVKTKKRASVHFTTSKYFTQNSEGNGLKGDGKKGCKTNSITAINGNKNEVENAEKDVITKSPNRKCKATSKNIRRFSILSNSKQIRFANRAIAI
jgi:hypothetical protein